MAAVLNSCASNTISSRQHDINFKSYEGYLHHQHHLPIAKPASRGIISSQTSTLSTALDSQQYLNKLQQQLSDNCTATSTTMYPSLPKYHRSASSSVAAQQQMTTPNQHQNTFTGNHHHQFSSSSLAYGMPVSSGYSSQHSTLQKSYASSTVQRSSSSAEACRNYWGHSHPTSSALYRNERHHTKRKSAVELLAESKPFFVKTDNLIERTNFGASTLVCSGKRGRNGSNVILDEGKYNPSYGETTYTAAEAERRFGSSAAHRRSSHIHSQPTTHHHHAAHNSHTNTSANTSIYHGKYRMSMSSDGSQERDKLARYRKEHFGESIILNEVRPFLNISRAVSFVFSFCFRQNRFLSRKMWPFVFLPLYIFPIICTTMAMSL